MTGSDHVTKDKDKTRQVVYVSVLCLSRKYILYSSITGRPQTFIMVASCAQIVCFYLATNLQSLKLLCNYCVTKF